MKVGLCLPRSTRATSVAMRPRTRPSASTTCQVALDLGCSWGCRCALRSLSLALGRPSRSTWTWRRCDRTGEHDRPRGRGSGPTGQRTGAAPPPGKPGAAVARPPTGVSPCGGASLGRPAGAVLGLRERRLRRRPRAAGPSPTVHQRARRCCAPSGGRTPRRRSRSASSAVGSSVAQSRRRGPGAPWTRRRRPAGALRAGGRTSVKSCSPSSGIAGRGAWRRRSSGSRHPPAGGGQERVGHVAVRAPGSGSDASGPRSGRRSRRAPRLDLPHDDARAQQRR